MLIGVVGKPSTGKSTFFKAVTLAEAETANYPFTTIKPNHAVGYTKVECVDKEFDTQCNPRIGYCTNHNRFVPIDLLDVAGLVPGASEGAGMGSQFLDDLNQANALIHVIDISGSTNEKGEPVDVGSYDPANDIRFLEIELDQWYLRILKNGWAKFTRSTKQTGLEPYKAIAKQMSGLRVTEEIAKDTLKELDFGSIETWTEEQILSLATKLREKTKPMIIAANKIDVAIGKENLEKVKKLFPNYTIIGCSAATEFALKDATKKGFIKYVPGEKDFTIVKELNDKQKQGLDFIKKSVLEQFQTTGVQQIIDKVVFDTLKMITIFPGGVNKLADKDGNVLPDTFLIREGSTALDFAFKLHTDIGKGFIRAIDVKTKRTVGKDHILKNRDVIEIITKA
jgi:ribosome-binding ATPase